MDILIGIIYTFILLLVGMALGSFFTFYKVFKERKKEEDLEDEIEYTCCNIEINGEIRDHGRCPECKENL